MHACLIEGMYGNVIVQTRERISHAIREPGSAIYFNHRYHHNTKSCAVVLKHMLAHGMEKERITVPAYHRVLYRRYIGHFMHLFALFKYEGAKLYIDCLVALFMRKMSNKAYYKVIALRRVHFL